MKGLVGAGQDAWGSGLVGALAGGLLAANAVLKPRGEQAAAESARTLDLIFDDKAPQILRDEFAAYRDV